MVKMIIVKLGTNSIKKIVEANSDTCSTEDLRAAEEINCWELIPEVKDKNHESKNVILQFTRPGWAPAEARDIPRIVYEETIDGWEFSGMISEASTRKIKFIKPD